MDKPRVWLSPWSIHSKKSSPLWFACQLSFTVKEITKLSVDTKKASTLCTRTKDSASSEACELYWEQTLLGLSISSGYSPERKHNSKHDIWLLQCNYLDILINTAEPALGALQDGRRSLEAPSDRWFLRAPVPKEECFPRDLWITFQVTTIRHVILKSFRGQDCMASLTKHTNNPGEIIRLYSSSLSSLKKNIKNNNNKKKNIGIQLWDFGGYNSGH